MLSPSCYSRRDLCMLNYHHAVKREQYRNQLRYAKLASRGPEAHRPTRRAHERRPSLVVFALFLVELTLLIRCGILVLLVLRHQVIHVRLGLSELHLVHTLTCVPMQESLASKHCREIFSDALEHFLDGCRVSGEGHRHLQALRRDVAH